jgi:hypothetical protein
VDNPKLKQEAMLVSLNGQAVAKQLPEALSIMDQLPQLDPATLSHLSNRITPEGTPTYHAWVEKAYAEG